MNTTLRWILWITLLVGAGFGLPNYRIDNDVARWTPQLADDSAGGLMVLGYVRDAPFADDLERGLAGDPAVRPPLAVKGDGTMDGLLVFPAKADDRSAAYHAVDRVLKAADHHDSDPVADRVALAGPPVFRAALDQWSQKNLPLASGLIFALGGIAMALTTRRARAVAESLFAVFSAQVLLVGLISWTGTPMDMVLSITPPLLMGLGFSFAAHRAQRPHVNGILALSAATTALSLGLFAFTDFSPIRAFALWGAVGIGVTWLAVFLLVTPRNSSPPVEENRTPDEKVSAPRRHPRINLRDAFTVVTALLITGAGVFALPRLVLDDNTLDYFPSTARIVQDARAMDAQLTGTLPFTVELNNPAVNPETLLLDTPGVRRVQRAGPTTWLGLATADAVPALVAAQPAWQQWAAHHQTTLAWRGVAAQIDHIGRAVRRTALWALPTMLVVAAGAALLIDPRPRILLLTVWVNAFPVAALALLLYLVGRPLSLSTLLISALAIGVAVDDTLHLLHAARPTGSITRAVRHCARPCIGSSLAVTAAMLAFLVCPFVPTAEFGLVMATAVVAALASDLVLLPAAARLIGVDSGR